MTDKCGPRGGAFTMDSMPNAESLPQDPLSYPYPNISSFPAPPSTSWIRDVAEKRFLSERQVGPSLADSFPWTRSIFQQLNIQRAAQSIWMLGGHLAFFLFFICVFPFYLLPSMLLLLERKLMRQTGFWRNLMPRSFCYVFFFWFSSFFYVYKKNIEIIYQQAQKKATDEQGLGSLRNARNQWAIVCQVFYFILPRFFCERYRKGKKHYTLHNKWK